MFHNKQIVILLIAVLFAYAATPVSTPVLKNTLPASWDENWFGSAVVYDLDRDGSMEIIAGRHSVLYVWRAGGTLLWRAPVGEPATSANDHGKFRQYASPVVGDLNNDGFGEIAIAYSDSVAVYTHLGALLAGWPKKFPGAVSSEIRSIAGSDLNGDKKVEILVVKTNASPVTMVWDIAGNPYPGWPQVVGQSEANDFGGYNQNIGVADLDGDKIPEVVSTYDICHIGIMRTNGSQFSAHADFKSAGPWASSVPMFHDIALAKQGWGSDGNYRDEFTNSPPCFGDIDGDGIFEVILYSDLERAGEYVNRGNALWGVNGDMTRCDGFMQPSMSGMPLFTGYENNIVQVSPTPALADLDRDGIVDIVVPSYDGIMRGFNSKSKLLWSYLFDNDAASFIGASGAAIADLNNDSLLEIVFCTYSTAQDKSHLLILSSTGTLLYKVALVKRGSMSPPTIADIDGDVSPEIIISLKDVVGGGDGGVEIWTVASARDNYISWPTGRGNYLQTGVSPQGVPIVSIKKENSLKGIKNSFKAGAVVRVYSMKGQLIFESNSFEKNNALKATLSSGLYLTTIHSLNKVVEREIMVVP